MIQNIVLLALSWALIWWYEKGDLSVLGWQPTGWRLKRAALLFALTAFCCASGFWMRMYFGKEQFAANPDLTPALVLTGIWLNVQSVLFEELLCRGVGLYILLKKWGPKWAIPVSAAVFGVLHWFNQGVFGNVVQMALLFAFTFCMGLLLAYAFAKSYSLYLPFAIHLGWNLVQNFVFPEGPYGNQLLVQVLPTPEVTVSYLAFFLMFFFPKIAAVTTNYLVLKYGSA